MRKKRDLLCFWASSKKSVKQPQWLLAVAGKGELLVLASQSAHPFESRGVDECDGAVGEERRVMLRRSQAATQRMTVNMKKTEPLHMRQKNSST